MGVLLFIPGGLSFQKGWLIMGAMFCPLHPAGERLQNRHPDRISVKKNFVFRGVLFIPMLMAGLVVMYLKSPELLKKRLHMREEEGAQRKVIGFSALMFIVSFLLAGFNERFKWWPFPFWVSIVGAVLFLLGYLTFAEVLRENAYLSRTVEVQENQKVVDTGLYGIVRHPIYLGSVILFWSMPLVLGSLLSMLPMLGYLPLIVTRIKNEEEVLSRGLAGYEEYKKVKSRLFPGLW